MRTFCSLLLILATTGCAFIGSGARSGDPFRDAGESQVAVFIENRTASDVMVEAVGPGVREEIGLVAARANQRVGVRWTRTQNLRFQLSPVAGRRYTTNDVNVGPGDRVFLVIQAPLDRSYVQR
ncbi:MAG: hypothetical protein EA352_10755 [Gemmatimonadales bacterium]|nr:MAG: hypothetical protein EA352_10755 [Gemmatimonadales bacterium]